MGNFVSYHMTIIIINGYFFTEKMNRYIMQNIINITGVCMRNIFCLTEYEL